MHMQKNGTRLLALTLALLFGLFPLLSLAADGASPLLLDGRVLRSSGSVLYYLSEDGEKLVPVVRQLSLLPSETMAEALVKALAREEKGLLSPFPKEARVRLVSIEQSGAIATVNLAGSFSSMGGKALFCLKAAVVNTLTEAGGIEYVNLLFNGTDLPITDAAMSAGLPTGTLTHITKDLGSAWAEYQNEMRNAARTGFERNVTLYFRSADGHLLLPEVRTVSFTTDDYIGPILAELIRGPKDTQHLIRTLPPSLSLLDEPSYYFFQDGGRYADLNFNYILSNHLRQQPALRQQILGSVVCTLATFIPNLSGVHIRINRRYPEQNDSAYQQERIYIRAQYEALLGRTLTLCLPKADGRLQSVQRAVEPNAAGLRDLLKKLIEGPLPDEELLAPFPEEFNSSHVAGLCTLGETLLFNLSSRGAELLGNLSEQQESRFVYSVVNSYTSLPGIRRVLFLEEGKSLKTLSGFIDLREPLLRNPALLQQTLN